jgi:hypothetical protein
MREFLFGVSVSLFAWAGWLCTAMGTHSPCGEQSLMASPVGPLRTGFQQTGFGKRFIR